MATDAPAAFFSYCRVDSEFAVRLAEDLKAAGAKVWLDQLDIQPGMPWDRAVEKALNDCPCVIVILSPTSVNSDNVRDEVSFALSKQKRVIPVLYRECDIPFRMGRLQYIDFREDFQLGFKALLKTLGAEQSLHSSAPAFNELKKDSLSENDKHDLAVEEPPKDRPTIATNPSAQNQPDRESKLDSVDLIDRKKRRFWLLAAVAGVLVVGGIIALVIFSRKPNETAKESKIVAPSSNAGTISEPSTTPLPQAAARESVKPPNKNPASPSPQATSKKINPTEPVAASITTAHPTLIVHTNPGQVQVYVDDTLMGTTNAEGRLQLSTLSPGRHRVRLSLDKYRDETQEVELVAGSGVQVESSLQPIPLQKPKTSEVTTNQPSVPPRNRESIAVDVGSVAPDFTLTDQNGNKVSLRDFRGKKNVALAFYVFAFTGGWTKQMQNFQQNLAKLEAADTQVLGVSMDSPFSNKEWAEEIGITFPLLSDWGGDVTRQYGLYNPKYQAARRVNYLIDREGKVVEVQLDSDAIDPTKVVEVCQARKANR